MRMRTARFIVLGTVVAGALAALAVPAGLIDPTRVFGELIATATGLEAPPLDDPAMIRRGAGHFDAMCADCHASPDRPERGNHLALTPPAPKLFERLGDRPPEALFLVVKHGVSGTGMPAWPTPHRDDEVWDVIAFLEVLPQLDADAYRELAGADRIAASTLPVASCARCHGDDGAVADAAFPRLDIQTPQYLYATLRAFRDGERASGFMQSAVDGLRDDELQSLAEHYGTAAVPDGEPGAVAGPAAPVRDPACTACHGPPHPARPEFPRLDGQHPAYLDLQLRLFAEGYRGGTAFAPLMHEVARSLRDQPPP